MKTNKKRDTNSHNRRETPGCGESKRNRNSKNRGYGMFDTRKKTDRQMLQMLGTRTQCKRVQRTGQKEFM